MVPTTVKLAKWVESTTLRSEKNILNVLTKILVDTS